MLSKPALILIFVILSLSNLVSTKDGTSTKAPLAAKKFPWWAIVLVAVIFVLVLIAAGILICIIRDSKRQQKEAEARKEVQNQLKLSRQHMSAAHKKTHHAHSPGGHSHDEGATVTATDATHVRT